MFKKWFKDFDVKLEVFLNYILDLSWQKLVLLAIAVVLLVGVLFGFGVLLFWTVPPVASFIWSGIVPVAGWVWSALTTILWCAWIVLRSVFYDFPIWLWNGITYDLWAWLFSLYWNAEFWKSFKPPGDELGYFAVFAKVLILGLIAALLFLWALPTYLQSRKAKKEAAKKDKKDAAKDESDPRAKVKLQTRTDKHGSVWVPVPFQTSAAVYGYLWGRGNYRRTIDDDSPWYKHLKFPYFEIVEYQVREEVDVEFATEMLPTGPKRFSSPDRPGGESEKDAERVAIDLERKSRRVVGGEIQIPCRLTLSVRPGAGVRKIKQAGPEYQDVKSDAVKARFSTLTSARCKQSVAQIPFEDGFFVPAMVILLGTPDEIRGRDFEEGADESDESKILVGAKRWKHLFRTVNQDPNKKDDLRIKFTPFESDVPPPDDDETQPKFVNLFEADLSDPVQLRAVLSRRPQSLLRTFHDLGYRVLNFGTKDINTTEEADKALKARLVAEINRDKQLTVWISEYVDQASARSDGRRIDAKASVFTYHEFVKAARLAYKEEHGTDADFKLTPQEHINFMTFLEDRRAKRLMEGRVMIIESGVGGSIPPHLAPLYAAIQQQEAAQTSQKPDAPKPDQSSTKAS